MILTHGANSLERGGGNLIYSFNPLNFDVSTLKDGNVQWEGTLDPILTKFTDHLQVMFPDTRNVLLQLPFSQFDFDFNDFSIEMVLKTDLSNRAYFGYSQACFFGSQSNVISGITVQTGSSSWSDRSISLSLNNTIVMHITRSGTSGTYDIYENGVLKNTNTFYAYYFEFPPRLQLHNDGH